MAATAHIPTTPARRGALVLGCLFCLSFLSLRGEGFEIILPLAALHFGVGALATERIARWFLIVEFCVVLGLLGYEVLTYQEPHAP
jgi:hypothetical protein